MKRPRFPRRRWLALALVPAFSWAIVLALVPTEWARTRMADRLAAATGRSVRIGALRLKVQDARIRVVDEPSGTRFDLTGVRGDATTDGRLLMLNGMKGDVNGGSFEMAARLERDPISPRFELEFRAKGVMLDQGMPALAYLVPVVAGTTNGVGGKL